MCNNKEAKKNKAKRKQKQKSMYMSREVGVLIPSLMIDGIMCHYFHAQIDEWNARNKFKAACHQHRLTLIHLYFSLLRDHEYRAARKKTGTFEKKEKPVVLLEAGSLSLLNRFVDGQLAA